MPVLLRFFFFFFLKNIFLLTKTELRFIFYQTWPVLSLWHYEFAFLWMAIFIGTSLAFILDFCFLSQKMTFLKVHGGLVLFTRGELIAFIQEWYHRVPHLMILLEVRYQRGSVQKGISTAYWEGDCWDESS